MLYEVLKSIELVQSNFAWQSCRSRDAIYFNVMLKNVVYVHNNVFTLIIFTIIYNTAKQDYMHSFRQILI